MDDGRKEERNDDFNIRLICLSVFRPFRSSLSALTFFLSFPFLSIPHLSFLPSALSSFIASSNKPENKRRRGNMKKWRKEERKGVRKPVIIDTVFLGDIVRSDTNVDVFSVFLFLPFTVVSFQCSLY